MSKLVRLYPYNPRRGWLMKTYLDPQLGDRRGGMKFLGKRGWYEVSDEVSEELEDVRQQDQDPRSGPAFLIARSPAHAKKLDEDLRDPEEDEASVGTADTPVRHGRPGKRKGKGNPKTRKRKSKAESGESEKAAATDSGG